MVLTPALTPALYPEERVGKRHSLESFNDDSAIGALLIFARKPDKQPPPSEFPIAGE